MRTSVAARLGLSRLGDVYYGWWIVGAGGLISAIGSVHQAAFSVFFLPLSKELGVSRATFSFVFSMARLEGGIESPVVGWVIDRYGPKLPIVVGAILAGVGYVALAMTDSFWPFVLIYMGPLSIGFQMGFITSMHAVSNLWFIRYRTRAMSVSSSSLRLGGAALTPLISVIVLAHGWKTGAWFAAAIILLVAFPLTLIIRNTPESMGLLPDGVKPGEGNPAKKQQATETATVDFTLKEALRTPAYWLIIISTTVRFSVIGAVHLHFIPIFVEKGFSAQTGANFAGLTSLVATPLILLNGWLGDRFSKRLVLMAGQTSLLVSMFILVYAESIWPLYIFAMLFSYGEGVSPANYSILGEYFGRRTYATLRGSLGTFTLMSMVSPVYAGWVYDRTGSYTTALFTFAGVAAFAAFLLLFLVRPKKKVTEAVDAGTPPS